jgi:hypothetical protein
VVLMVDVWVLLTVVWIATVEEIKMVQFAVDCEVVCAMLCGRREFDVYSPRVTGGHFDSADWAMQAKKAQVLFLM